MADVVKSVGLLSRIPAHFFICFCITVSPALAIIAQAPSDCKRADTDTTHEFFDISQLRCTPCSQDSQYQTVSADGLRCICKNGLRLTKNYGGAEITCEPCAADKVVSASGWECIACSTAANPDSCPDCPTKQIQVERLLNGQYTQNAQNESTRACTTCAADTHPDETGGRCVRCSQILSMLPSQSDCTCPTTQQSGGVCFQKATDLVPDAPTLYLVKFETIDPVDSAFFSDNLRAAHGMCNAPYSNLTACQLLGNLCVMQRYARLSTSRFGSVDACSLYVLLQEQAFIGLRRDW